METVAALGAEITDAEFQRLKVFFLRASGIHLAECKKVLVCGRLSRRLRALRLQTYKEYLDYIEQADHGQERQLAVDLLTTNETHFFREPKHFELLRTELEGLMERGASSVRVWSAASSTGEEPYSLAMVMAEVLGARSWSVFASDLSMKVLEEAKRGIYGAQRASEIPDHLARKYVLEGIDEYEGQYRIDAYIRQRVHFGQINLVEPLPTMEHYDFIFLRNVLIYFDKPTKKKIVESVASKLKRGGLLFIGHSETLGGVTEVVEPVVPTVYRRAK